MVFFVYSIFQMDMETVETIRPLTHVPITETTVESFPCDLFSYPQSNSDYYSSGFILIHMDKFREVTSTMKIIH